MIEHPMQPVYLDDSGIIRFHPNKIVSFLLDWASPRGVDMNTLAIMDFSKSDREQFAQLIGYSVSGFAELSYVRDKTYEKASKLAKPIRERIERKIRKGRKK